MQYLDPITNERYTPSVVEYSIGADRLTLALMCEAYDRIQAYHTASPSISPDNFLLTFSLLIR